MIVCCGIAMNEGLKIFTDCEFPLVVDLSGTMEPAFSRGDLLMLSNYTDEPIRSGDIVVINIHRISMPIAHRVIEVNEEEVGSTKYLTKGDENVVDDRGLYEPGQKWLERRHIVGKVKGVVPYLGKINIFIHTNVVLKVQKEQEKLKRQSSSACSLSVAVYFPRSGSCQAARLWVGEGGI
ncbi:hypothetical protein PRIPAC_87020 [Pristionchus pacificus]|uniref:Signal peptidase complex catalytic subunit SEC11 n=1 Tax=Pristionchus pacificus TaxID=54126 RepID=A0A2A6BUC6_PRIPA|nr:hypothetical protein PRIPAC_87020 [Pristionchus pacificus]|eukprot:PDM69413.1 Peptidase [Pristionchus pacificus]